MTLIAAYRPFGIPVLLGDFLVTGGSGLHTSKKIQKLGPNFVVGWTGRRVDARRILRGLYATFRNRLVSVDEVTDHLKRIPLDQQYREELHLIGWVIEDNNPYCFLWNIQYPNEIFPAPYHTDGTGGKTFEDLMKQDIAGSAAETPKGTEERALTSVLFKACQLYSTEVMDRIENNRTFGHGYELLYFDGVEFRYLDDIAFGAADISWNYKTDSGTSRPFRFWYNYHSLGSHSTMRMLNAENGDLILETISPLVGGENENAVVEFEAGSPRARFYCLFFRIFTQRGESFASSVVLSEVNVGPSQYVKFIDGRYAFQWGEALIRRIVEDARARKAYYEKHTSPIGWGGGQARQQITEPNTRFVFRVQQNDKTVVGGLTTSLKWDHSYRSFDFAIMCGPDEVVQIYEDGHAVGPLGITYAAGDLFSLDVRQNGHLVSVEYLRNDLIIYRSHSSRSLPLTAVVGLREEGAAVRDAQIVSR